MSAILIHETLQTTFLLSDARRGSKGGAHPARLPLIFGREKDFFKYLSKILIDCVFVRRHGYSV